MNSLTQIEQAYPSPWRAWRVTGLLTVIYVFSFVDRQVLNLLVGPIQSDLGLSDTEVSLLQGFGFVATYVLLSIPIGRLVDTRNRVTIIALGVAFWSIATAACGLVKSFMGLLMANAFRPKCVNGPFAWFLTKRLNVHPSGLASRRSRQRLVAHIKR